MTPEQAKTREFQESRDGVAERERTAAMLLAAMVRNHGTIDSLDSVERERGARYAVAWADELRKALRGGE